MFREFDENMDLIKRTVGFESFMRGLRYDDYLVGLLEIEENDTKRNFHFEVESETSYNFYDVYIKTEKGIVKSYKCDCPKFKKDKTCKHVAACMILHKDEIFEADPEARAIEISKSILNSFYAKPQKNSTGLKKQVRLEIELYFTSNSWMGRNVVEIKIKIGETRMYNLNIKMDKFLKVFESETGKMEFGKAFTYEPSKHFFSKADQAFLEFILEVKNKNSYYDFNSFIVSSNVFLSFLDYLKERDFYVAGCGRIDKVLYESPIELQLNKLDNGNYEMIPNLKDVKILLNDNSYAVKGDTFYVIPPKVRAILSLMKENRLEKLVFEEESLDTFKRGILPIVKDKIQLDETLQDKFLIGIKPNIKLYMDLNKNVIVVDFKLEYGDKVINYFEEDANIVREDEIEQECLKTLLEYGFIVDKKKIYMEDYESIGEFLEEGLENLAKDYEVFTTNKLKDANILKNSTIRSAFSIGKDNLMRYEFELGDIKSDEIVDILETMKAKKKYYRLKSGDFLNLEENDELKQLENLVDDMELSKKDIAAGSGVIPKYRAIYLDSVKKDKYNIIKTDNLFDKLIENFNSYKNAKIKFSKQDKEILRDYQVTGVKWLYNIYKCGFGGILADEMGLGKSIQLIYFIKEVLKEKPEAKILIVAPTSLVYNWKNEFDKFGSELKYKVFAENKAVRKEELNHVDDLNIIITTYGLVRQDREQYVDMNFELIAIDEAQNIKNSNAQMTKIVKELKASTKIALTGTPLENSVMELWSIFDFIMPGYLSNMLSFSRKYNIKDVKDEDLGSLENLNRQIRPFILRRKKKDVVKELPDKIENNIYIDLNPEQKKLYVAQLEKTQKEMEEILRTEGFKKGNFKILQLLTKLRQLCIDPRIIYENYQGGSAKIDNLIELCKGIIANGHKILVFTSYKTALDIVNLEMTNNNISTYVIDGSVSSKKRMELVDKFNNDDTNVFLITLKAGGTGLNLTSADVVIHLDLWWNPQVENQATDRAHRIGQKNTVEVIKLISTGTIEERILELQNKKKILSETLIEGEDRDKNLISKLSEKDIKRLLSLDNEDYD